MSYSDFEWAAMNTGPSPFAGTIFPSLKMERVGRRDYANQAEAEKDVADYIVGLYNSVRLHSNIGISVTQCLRAFHD